MLVTGWQQVGNAALFQQGQPGDIYNKGHYRFFLDFSREYIGETMVLIRRKTCAEAGVTFCVKLDKEPVTAGCCIAQKTLVLYCQQCCFTKDVGDP